jgi:hypothetical protein
MIYHAQSNHLFDSALETTGNIKMNQTTLLHASYGGIRALER